MPVALEVNRARNNCKYRRDPYKYRYKDIIHKAPECSGKFKPEIIAYKQPEQYCYYRYHCECGLQLTPNACCHNDSAVSRKQPESLAVIIISGIAPILTSSSSTNTVSAAITNTLSANGSRNLPKLVTRLRFRAIFPSRASVMDAAANIISAMP